MERGAKVRGHLPARKNILNQILKATNPTMNPHSAVIPAENLIINDTVSVASGDTWPLPLVTVYLLRSFFIHISPPPFFLFVCFLPGVGNSSRHTACTKGTLELADNQVLWLFVVSCRFAGKGQFSVCTEGSEDTLFPILVNYSLPFLVFLPDSS